LANQLVMPDPQLHFMCFIQFQGYGRIANVCLSLACPVTQDASPPTSSRPPTPTPATIVGAGDPPQPLGAVLPPVPSPSGRVGEMEWDDGSSSVSCSSIDRQPSARAATPVVSSSIPIEFSLARPRHGLEAWLAMTGQPTNAAGDSGNCGAGAAGGRGGVTAGKAFVSVRSPVYVLLPSRSGRPGIHRRSHIIRVMITTLMILVGHHRPPCSQSDYCSDGADPMDSYWVLGLNQTPAGQTQMHSCFSFRCSVQISQPFSILKVILLSY